MVLGRRGTCLVPPPPTPVTGVTLVPPVPSGETARALRASRLVGEGAMGVTANRYGVSFGVSFGGAEDVLELDSVMVTHPCECTQTTEPSALRA